MDKAAVGIAGVNTRQLADACLGVAGIDSRRVWTQHQPACVGVAGNWGSPLRPVIQQVMSPPPVFARARIGDRAAQTCRSRAVYMLDYTYVVCPGEGGMRYRAGFESLFSPEWRTLPVVFDSCGFREFTGTAPSWSGYNAYVKAIDLVKPELVMSKDVIGDQQQSLHNYERMCADGYGAMTVPVYQTRPLWDDRAGARLQGAFWADTDEAVRTAIGNARTAAADPVMRYYTERSRLVAMGGMVQGPCPRSVRHVYLGELCRLYPDHQFWGLGQASATVINGLNRYGLIERVWTDGSWWIHHARTEQIAVVKKGLITAVRLTGTGSETFFTMSEMMAACLRSLAAVYAGIVTSPGQEALPTEMRDPDQREELRRRIRQSNLMDILAIEEDDAGDLGADSM